MGEAGLPRDVTRVGLPRVSDFPGLPEVHDALPNPDDGGGIPQVRIGYTNRDQIPLGFDPGSCIWGDRLVVDFPERIYRIVGKVIAHAPYQGIIPGTGYTSADLPE